MAEGGDLAATNENKEQPPVRRSTRKKKELVWFVVHKAVVDIEDTEDLIMDAQVQDPDIMYYNEVKRELDRDQFLQGMDKAVNTEINKVWFAWSTRSRSPCKPRYLQQCGP